MCKINCSGGCSECAPDGHDEEDNPVAAQEPIAEVFVSHRYVGFGRVERCNDIKWLKEAPPVGTKLYAAPCARSAEQLEDRIEKYASIHLLTENEKLQAKITEQANQIEALEAKVEQWKIHAKEILSGEFDKVIHGLDLQATIERQRKVIEQNRLAIDAALELAENCGNTELEYEFRFTLAKDIAEFEKDK